MRRAGKWLVALLASAAAFAAVWWLCDRRGLPSDVALGVAGAAAGLVLAPLGWWAGREPPAVAAPGPPQPATASGAHGQAVGAVSGGTVVGAGSTVTFVGVGPYPPPGPPPPDAPPDPPSDPPPPGARPAGPPPPDVDLDELPSAALEKIIGRTAELASLHRLCLDENTSVVAVTGFGGTGKTSLVDAFLADLAPDYAGAERVFGWHFHSQEEQGSATSSSSLFWDRALRFFGFTGDLPAHETEKAYELCRLFRDHKVILVLDGIESLQHPPHVNGGLLSDKALQRFLTSVARDGLPRGALVVTTSRQPVVELRRFDHAHALAVGPLDDDSGRQLLRTLGVEGSADELRSTVADYRGHPLSLVLLAKILVSDYHGDVLQRFNVELHSTEVEDNVGALLDYYTRALAEDDPELVYLYLISLFRRPARTAELDQLVAGAGIAEPLRRLPGPRAARAVSRLKGRGLVIAETDYHDTHALIRRYFAARFAELHPAEFRQANDVLFEYFAGLPDEEQPATLDDLEPLYRAIHHGCLAGRYADALDVYWRRISRERAFYSQKQLGAFSADLVAVAPFFPDDWDRPATGDLTPEHRAFLLALASFLLTALGRLTEASRPRYTEIAVFEALGDWRMVCGDLRNLVQILLPLGLLGEALRASERAVSAAERLTAPTPRGTYSEDMDDTYLWVSALARKATVLHRLGRLDPAGAEFERAEAVFGRPLDRINGFYYGLYLLDTAAGPDDLRGVVRRGEENLRFAVERANVGDVGHGHLTLGTAHARLAEFDAAADHLDAAVAKLRAGGRVDRLPGALIARARCERARWLATGSGRHLQRCESDLAEADQIIAFSRMALYLVELNLVRCWLLADRGEAGRARELIATAIEPGIDETGYRLRAAEVAELTARLDGVR